MGFDTKPNLSDNKFEQFSGEILSLSGCTDIYGELEIKTSGSFLLADGTQGLDRVMTSDASGKGTWDSTPYMTCGANGLCSIGHNVVLGGTLTGNTNICINNHQLSLGQTSDETRLTISQSFPYIISEVCENSFTLLGSCICINAQVGSTKSGMIFYYDCNIWSSDCMLLTSSGFTFTDNNNSGGMKYSSNYCNDFVDRSLVDKEYVDDAIGGGTGSAYDSENVTKEVTQSSHGFAKKDFIGWSGGTYNKAIADGNYDGEFVGIVTEVPDGNTFKLTQSGYITGLTSLVIDTTYFLSPTVAGNWTSTEPSTDGQISKSIFIANSTTSGWVFPYPGFVVSSGATVISTANNGLTDNGGIVQLGGALCQTTTITGLDSYDLEFTGNWLKYSDDYSAGIGPRDIPDAEWITGNTGTGNVNWDGSTANGIGTYVDSDTICSEPNLTFDGSTLSITGGLKVTAPATKSTETNILYIADDGTVASGATSGGGGGIDMSGSTVNGITTYVDADTICAQSGLIFSGTTLIVEDCLKINASGSTAAAHLIICADNGKTPALFFGYEDSAASSTHSVTSYNRGTGASRYYAGYFTALSVTAESQGRSIGLFATAGNRSAGYNSSIVGVVCGTCGGVGILGSDSGTWEGTAPTGDWAAYFRGATMQCGILCSRNNIEFCQGTTRTICIDQATDGGAGDSLNICAGAGDDDTSPLAGGNLRLEGGTGGADTDTGNGGVGGYGILCGGVGGAGHASANGGIGGAAYVRGGAGGDGDTDGCGGHVYVCGGYSSDNTAGDVYICGGSGQTGGCVAIYHDATKRLHTTTTGMYTTGDHIVTSDIVFPSPTTHTKWICGQASTTPSNLLITPSESTDATAGGALYLQGGTNSSTGYGGNIYICGGSASSAVYCGDICIIGACSHIKGCTNISLCAGVNRQVYIVSGSCVELSYCGSGRLKTVTNGICLPDSSSTGCGIGYDWVSTSDRRLKKDIVPISSALSMVTQLCGVCYHFCDDEDKQDRIGLIAQDVEPILPEVVLHTEPDDDDEEKHGITDGKLTIKYDKITAVLVEAIKEQQIQINCLQEEINEIKNK